MIKLSKTISLEKKMMESQGKLLDAKQYNLLILGMLLYGCIVNVLLCQFVPMTIFSEHYFIALIAYVLAVFAGITIARKTKNEKLSFLGFNLVVIPMGVVLSPLVSFVAGNLVFKAFVLTGVITACMMSIGMLRPHWFEKAGSFLFISLIAIVAAEIACWVFKLEQDIITWVAVLVFTGYIGYDTYKAQTRPHTVCNAIDSAISLYVDIINVFVRLLELFGNVNDFDIDG